MRGKLSWMVVAIIGGVIVTVGIFLFLGFFGSSMLEMLISAQAIKAGLDLAGGINKAIDTGGDILPQWTLDWTDCEHAYHDATTSGIVHTDWCQNGAGGAGAVPWKYRGDVKLDRTDIIFIVNRSEFGDYGKFLDYFDINDQYKKINACGGSDYCLCVVSAKVKAQPYNQYFYYFTYRSGSNAFNDQCYWGSFSIYTYDSKQALNNSIEDAKTLACVKIKSGVKMKISSNEKEVLAIQHLKASVYLNRVNDSNGNYYVDMTFRPSTVSFSTIRTTLYVIPTGSIMSGDCAFIYPNILVTS